EQQYDIAPDDGGAFRARVMLMRKNDQRLATVFYLVTRRDVRMTPGIRQRLIDIVNRMVFRRSDLTVVRISSPVVSDSVEETVAALEQFARQIDTYVTEILRKAG
ncbi:MAG TPA: exosortase-associated EpsI family protein, partial [bacterium]|nr:exosortase-associated EpsI family protein [bacterium]